MDKAYSLIKRSLVPAEAISYRENISNQIICHVCGEPVFKKEMRVEGRDEKTHFLSHYVGDPTSCKERAQQNYKIYSDREKSFQLQRLSEFDAFFRIQILEVIRKNSSIKFFKQNGSNFEFSVRVAEQDLKITSLNLLSNKVLKFLSEKLEFKVNTSLKKLDDALIPISKHLGSQFGWKNLRFLTCIAVIDVYKSSNLSLEDMLKSSNLNKQEFFDEKLFAAIKLILSGYIHWQGSIEKITSYISNLSKEKILKSTSKKLTRSDVSRVAKICSKCNRVHYLNDSKCDYCNGYKVELAKRPEISKIVTNKSLDKSDSVKSNGVLDAKLCEHCQKYSYTREDCCPLCYRQYKLPPIQKSPEKSLTNKKIDVIKEIPYQYCKTCNTSYMSSTANTCPSCFKQNNKQSAWKWKFCELHRLTYLPNNGDRCPKCISAKSWLKYQPWDEENLKAHKKLKK